MASGYPVSIDSLPTTHSDSTNEIIHATTDNDQSDAINHIETELGTVPKGSYSSVGARLAALEFPTIEHHNVTAYTLQKTDKNKVKSFINASPCVVTVPPSASVPGGWDIGTVIVIRQGSGAGTVSFGKGTGVNIFSKNNSLTMAGPVTYATLYCIAADTWDLFGDLV